MSIFLRILLKNAASEEEKFPGGVVKLDRRICFSFFRYHINQWYTMVSLIPGHVEIFRNEIFTCLLA